MRHISWIVLVVAGFVAVAGAPPRAQAAHLVSGPNFPWGGIGCAIPNGLDPFPPGTAVFLDQGCQYFPKVDWAIGDGGRIIASGLAEGNKFACLDEASTTAGAAVVVNPCAARRPASQSWEIKPAPNNVGITLIVNRKSKLCLDTKQAGPDVIQLVVNDCAQAISAGQNWQIK